MYAQPASGSAHDVIVPAGVRCRRVLVGGGFVPGMPAYPYPKLSFIQYLKLFSPNPVPVAAWQHGGVAMCAVPWRRCHGGAGCTATRKGCYAKLLSAILNIGCVIQANVGCTHACTHARTHAGWVARGKPRGILGLYIQPIQHIGRHDAPSCYACVCTVILI